MTELQRQIEPTIYKNEPRIDSRVISNELEYPKATIQLINEHEGSLKQLGLFHFKWRKSKQIGRFDTRFKRRSSLFPAHSFKNTDQAVQLKLNLVKAFSKARMPRN